MYVNQNENMGFHDVVEVLPIGVRSKVEGIAQHALHAAGVVCAVEEGESYTSMISREYLHELPGIQEAQNAMRAALEAF